MLVQTVISLDLNQTHMRLNQMLLVLHSVGPGREYCTVVFKFSPGRPFETLAWIVLLLD